MTVNKRNTLLTCSLVFSAIATIIAAYLLWATTSERQVFGCGAGSGCDKVLGSRWSLWLGQPVALFALGFYLLLLVCLFALRAPKGEGPRWISWLAAMVGSAGIVMFWFLGLQAFVIRSFCVYCLADHIAGLLAVASLLLYIKESAPGSNITAWILAPILAAGFIATHVIVEPTRIAVEEIAVAAEHPPGPHEPSTINSSPSTIPQTLSRRVKILDGNVSFDIYQIPHIGSSMANYIIMELFDYTCPHCRDLHEKLTNALVRYGDQLAIVTLPVPMNSVCNPNIRFNNPKHTNACVFAEYSLAVCAFDLEKFAPYHHWLMTGKDPPSLESAREKAEGMVGSANFEAALKDHWVKDWMADGRAMSGLGSHHGIPKLAVGSQIVVVSHISREKLFELLESSLGIKPLTDDDS